jgi:hypothetical protein
MADKAWKRTERSIAAVIGGQRIPITGRQRGDAPDIEHPWLSVEVKHRQHLPVWILDAMDQAVASARSDQLPVAILHEKGKRHSSDLVMVRLGDWMDWFGKGGDRGTVTNGE